MMWTELIDLAHPLLINLGYQFANEKPDLPDETTIEIPLLIKKGSEIMTVKQCAWGKHAWPIYYKVIESNQSTITELKKELALEKEADTRNMAEASELIQTQADTITDLEGKLEKAMRHQNHSYDCVMQNIDCKGECICGLDKQLKETCGE